MERTHVSRSSPLCTPALILAAGLAACSGRPTTGGLVPNQGTPGTLSPTSTAARSMLDGSPAARGMRIFTVNRDTPSIVAFRVKASGNVASRLSPEKCAIGVREPNGLALQVKGDAVCKYGGKSIVGLEAIDYQFGQ